MSSCSAHEAYAFIRSQHASAQATLGIVLGSGLGPLIDKIDNPITIPYNQIPGFPLCSVSGHTSQLVLGTIHGVAVACLQGRTHFYEGTDPAAMKTMIRTLKLLGCESVLITNSSGSLRPTVQPGALVAIHDHINHQFSSPLVGPNDDEFGPRFVSLENAYDPELRSLFAKAAQDLDIQLSEGVYIGVLGPAFETPAEIRLYQQWGGEVIGMSTIPDVLIARHCGLRVAVLAVITNMAVGMSDVAVTHETTLQGAQQATSALLKLVPAFIQHLK